MSWDDGKHAKVKRVQLTLDDVIRSIEVDYDGTSLKSQPRGTTVGTTAEGFTLSSDEYITEVTGYYRTIFSGDVITALTFKTNKKTYGPYGNKSRNYFTVTAPNDNQIAGFLGSSSNALNSINAHFASAPPSSGCGTTGGQGSDTGGNRPETNDTQTPGGQGSDTGGNRPETNDTQAPPGGQGSDSRPETDGSKITGGAGSQTTGAQGSDTSGIIPEADGSKTTGGQGSDISGKSNPEIGRKVKPTPQKVEAQGNCRQGNQWDDGADQDGVTKIHVTHGKGIYQISFDYLKNGQVKKGPVHGTEGRDSTSETMVINHGVEYLSLVEVWLNKSSNIHAIQFSTNTGFCNFYGDDEYIGDGNEFTLQLTDKKIIGFHGSAGPHLNSLGAYFAPVITEDIEDPVYEPEDFEVESDGEKESQEHGKITVSGTEDLEVESDGE